jgi:GrpB-like predicted nucleotidyltransferase (UPF0157 family)
VVERPDALVEVVPYRSDWAVNFEKMRVALASAVGDAAISVEHIGSTAVPGLAAKPTIDILMVVASHEGFLGVLAQVEALGFDHRPQNSLVGSDDHLFLRRVQDGQRTHHLHVVKVGSPEIDEYRRFRDALRRDPALAAHYESVKINLAAEYGTDRMRYVEAKSQWVDEWLRSVDGPRPTGSA